MAYEIAVFSTKPYDEQAFRQQSDEALKWRFLEPRLTADTVRLARDANAVCVFVHDQVDDDVLARLAEMQCRLVALRCAGYNNVDLAAAKKHGITVVRVPAYAPEGVAEFSVGLLMTLVRKYHRSHLRTREANFSLNGLMGFNLLGKTVGVVGTGKIGAHVARIMLGFGCRVIAFDPYPDDKLRHEGVMYVGIDDVIKASDIITLHCPLTPENRHLLDADAFVRARDGVVIVNTSRGGLIDTAAAIDALKSGKIGGLGIDVYENEEGVFFEDLSNAIVDDDQLMRLTTFPNVVVTSHQAFFTSEAMASIVATTVDNLTAFLAQGEVRNEVSLDGH